MPPKELKEALEKPEIEYLGPGKKKRRRSTDR